jgi:cobalt/nickel transport system permease protein
VRRNGFIEGSIHDLLGVIEYALESEDLAHRHGLLQTLDPRVKLLGILGLVVAASVSRRLEVIGALFGIATALAVWSYVPLRTLVLRVWTGAFVFTGLIALPAVFLTPGRPLWRLPLFGWPITLQGVRSAAYLISRVETTATLSMLLILCTPWAHLLKALRVLGIPVVLVVILGMTYRYIVLLIGTAQEMLQSRRSRIVGTLESKESRRLAIATAGVLLDKTLQLSGDVYLAMQSRGFRGEVYILNEFKMSFRDWSWLLTLLAMATAAVWLGTLGAR